MGLRRPFHSLTSVFTLVESDIYKMRYGGASLHSTGYTSWNLFDLSIANLCPSLLSRH